MNIEHRNLQIRASQGDEFALVGRALTYSQISSNELAPGLRERIMPGCFREGIVSGRDVKALLNHDAASLPLGRTANGTLTLTDSESGLDMRVQLDRNNSLHRDVYASVKRGDISEMSFAFVCEDEDISSEAYQGRACQVRNVRKAQLHDVSVVTSPFYGNDATAVAARSSAASTADLLARALAMPGDWERQEKARALANVIQADKIAQIAPGNAATAAAEAAEKEELDTLCEALANHFGKADHGLTPRYWPVERKAGSVVACDMNLYELPYVSIPFTRDEDDDYAFGEPEKLISYSATGRAANQVQEARTAKADGELRSRMRAAAGI